MLNGHLASTDYESEELGAEEVKAVVSLKPDATATEPQIHAWRQENTACSAGDAAPMRYLTKRSVGTGQRASRSPPPNLQHQGVPK